MIVSARSSVEFPVAENGIGFDWIMQMCAAAQNSPETSYIIYEDLGEGQNPESRGMLASCV